MVEAGLLAPTDNKTTDDIDEVLDKIGCGLSQYVIVAIVVLIDFIYGYQMLIMYYLGNDPSWTCVKKTSSGFCYTYFNDTFSENDDHFDERCSLNRSEWQYTKGSKYSLVTEYDLACVKEYLSSLADSAIFIGWGLGSIFTAILTDMYGRKIALLTATFFLEGLAIGSCYITAMWQLIIIRTLIGVCVGTVTSAGYIYMSEFSSTKFRSLCMNTIQLFFSVVLILLSALAMYVQEWRKLELYAAFPGIAAFFVMLFLPESPGWLHAMGKSEKADKILHKVVKFNKSDVDFTLISKSEGTIFDDKQYSYIDLFKTCPLVLLNSAQSVGWFTCGLVYYGLSLENSDLGGSIYVNLMLSSIADIIGSISGIYLLNKGRKRVTLSSFVFCAVTMVGLAIVQKSWNFATPIRITLAMIGKVCITISFGGYYIWTAELYPTIVRTQGMTICQMACRVGAAVAPFLTSVLQDTYQQLPFVVMCVVSILAAGCGLILPETNGQPTREKFEDLSVRHVRKKEVDCDVAPLVDE